MTHSGRILMIATLTVGAGSPRMFAQQARRLRSRRKGADGRVPRRRR